MWKRLSAPWKLQRRTSMRNVSSLCGFLSMVMRGQIGIWKIESQYPVELKSADQSLHSLNICNGSLCSPNIHFHFFSSHFHHTTGMVWGGGIPMLVAMGYVTLLGNLKSLLKGTRSAGNDIGCMRRIECKWGQKSAQPCAEYPTNVPPSYLISWEIPKSVSQLRVQKKSINSNC